MDSNVWPGSVEHCSLLETASELIDGLYGLRSRLEHRKDVEYAQHGEFADRARGFADYLRAAIRLAQADVYAPSLACTRAALEHMLVDRLVFLGRRYVQVVVGVDESTWAEWERQRTTGQAFTTVVDWHRTKKGHVEITYEGLRSRPGEDGESYLLSIHYFLLGQYQPYLGPPSVQSHFDDGLIDADRYRKHAEENRALYETYLSWASIKKSLLANGFADQAAITQLDVHYRFLSAFVHPVSDVAQLLYGRNQYNLPTYDHYSSELALLYAITLAVEELRHFREMTLRAPSIGIRDWDVTEDLCDRAWNQVSYLWFPGHPPHSYDRITEANRRAFRQLRTTRKAPTIENPSAIPADEIRYYRDPIHRLIVMHSGFHEVTTGLGFVSPWPRLDAKFRW